MEYRATVGKRPAASEPAVATVLQDAGCSVGQQQTKPRAGSASGPPQGPEQCVCCTARAGESRRHGKAPSLRVSHLQRSSQQCGVGLAWLCSTGEG